MRSIALYNRKGQRLLTLKEAEQKGYGSVDGFKKRINRGRVKAYKVGRLLLVAEDTLSRPVGRKARTRR